MNNVPLGCIDYLGSIFGEIVNVSVEKLRKIDQRFIAILD